MKYLVLKGHKVLRGFVGFSIYLNDYLKAEAEMTQLQHKLKIYDINKT